MATILGIGPSGVCAPAVSTQVATIGPSVLRAPAEQTKVATVGPSVLHAPAEQTKVATIGPSGVRALPLAAGINEGGHYFRYFGPSVLRAPAEQTKVATILHIFPLLVGTAVIQNHRRGCRRVSNFCMGP